MDLTQLNFISWRKHAFKFMVIGAMQYLIFTLIAMIFYAGGNLADPLHPGYDFLKNLFSDLGRIVAISGNSNLISYIIFTISALIFGGAFTTFIISFPLFFKDDKMRNLILITSLLMGLLSAFALFGSILTPWDVFGTVHLIFANIFNLTGSIVLILYALGIFRSPDYPNRYAYFFLGIFIMGIIYTIILLFIPEKISLELIIVQGGMQKLTQYLLIVCLIIQSYGAWKSIEKSRANIR
jgi:hypothetical protein